jgi:hypothetical protein
MVQQAQMNLLHSHDIVQRLESCKVVFFVPFFSIVFGGFVIMPLLYDSAESKATVDVPKVAPASFTSTASVPHVVLRLQWTAELALSAFCTRARTCPMKLSNYSFLRVAVEDWHFSKK